MPKITKPSGATCSVHSGPGPSRAPYNAIRRKIRRGSRKTDTARRSAFSRDVPYQPPHSADWPEYGAPCFIEAWHEMSAWLVLADAAATYIAAGNDPNVLPSELQALADAYICAMGEYNAAWYEFEVCINGMPT